MQKTAIMEENKELFEGGFLTAKEAAEFLRLGLTKVYELMNEGVIPYCKFGKSRRIPKQALVKLVKESLQNSNSL